MIKYVSPITRESGLCSLTPVFTRQKTNIYTKPSRGFTISPPQKTWAKTRKLGDSHMAHAVLKIIEKETGTEFPLVQKFGEKNEFRCLGAAPRLKKILFLKTKVYAIALYVEPAKAVQELKLRDRGDFFKDAEPAAFCDAILDGAFEKILQITMVRDISAEQFVEAIDEALAPKLRFIGATDVFESFKAYFTQQTVTKGSNILFQWRVSGDIDICFLSEKQSDFSKIEKMERFSNPGFSRSLFELYMGSSSIIPEARQAWADGAKLLLDSTKV